MTTDAQAELDAAIADRHDAQLAAIEKRLEELGQQLENIAAMVCPSCAPAVLARLHPELGPAPWRPNGADNLAPAPTTSATEAPTAGS